MSQRELEAVIGRAVLDEAFRHLLFAEPEAALTEYALTEAEERALRRMDLESLEGCGKLTARRVVAGPKETAPDDFSLDAI